MPLAPVTGAPPIPSCPAAPKEDNAPTTSGGDKKIGDIGYKFETEFIDGLNTELKLVSSVQATTLLFLSYSDI